MSRSAARRGRALESSAGTATFLGSRLRLLGVGLICAKLALVPIVFDHDSDVPFSVIKALVSHALAYVLAGVLVGLLVRYRRTVFVWSWVHVPVVVFLLANIAA